ncbi:MAG: hypothetical protein L6R35_006117 [Caloplaca aegaea]|nr:MAG: hypothetical protein L6R35_006117 [Caloplaca aegaea]
MAPSPAAGNKGPVNPPKTPTKQGKNPASSATSKLGQSTSAADSPKNTAKSATNTPQSAAKGAVGKAQSSAPSKATGSPKLPPRPQGAAPKAPGAAGKATDTADKAKGKAEDTAKDVKGKAAETKDQTQDKADDTKKGIDMKDNDAAEEADNERETPGGKVSQTGNDTQEESSAVSTNDDDGLSEAVPNPVDDDNDDDDTVGGAKDTQEGADDTDATEEAGRDANGEAIFSGGVAKKAQDTAGKAQDEVQDTAEGAQDKAKDTTGKAQDTTDEAAEGDVEGAAEGAVNGAKDTAQDTVEGAKDTAEETADGAQDVADDATEEIQDTGKGAVEDAEDKAQGAADDVDDAVPDEADGVLDEAKDTAEDVADDVPVDLSILKGLEVGEDGKIFNADGEQVGQLDEGDPEDLAGKTIGDDGEILDEDGDVIGRASALPGQVQDVADEAEGAADEAKGGLPEIGALEGLEVGEGGNIMGPDGTPLGKLVEGNPGDLIGKTLNEKGEIIDEDGDVVGRAMVVPGIDILEGHEIGESGNILNDEGEVIGKLTEGDAEQLAGQKINEAGEILDEDGDVIGRAEVIPPGVEDMVDEAQDEVQEGVDEAAPGITPDLSILEGKKVNKKGKILDEEGEVIGQLTEDSDVKKCAGKIPNENGEIVDAKDNVIGKVEVVPGEAADDAMKALHPELLEEAADEAEEQVPEVTPDFSILEGLKVNKKGQVLNEDGEPIGRLVEGEATECAGKKINEKGEVVGKDGNVIGKVEVIQGEAADEAMKELHPELIEEAKQAAKEAVGPDMSILEGLKVNKKGEVVNEDGDVVARLSEGELDAVRGKKINDQGEILDEDGNVLGKVELIPQEGEEEGEEGGEEDTGPELPPLSILEGLKCNKSGSIVDADGNPVGRLVEGDAKKLSRSGAECDAEGQFWDGKGHVIGRAETIAKEEKEEEAPFAGLEGLIVVKDGWVQDENENVVGVITEGDPKKLIGRAVDEDGDVLDKRGNVVGHAERYEEPEAPEEEKPDLSILKGLVVNKEGNVIGPDGVPIARLVEGNAKELAGRKCDEEGQIWNDSGKVVGRCALIPENEREAKPEGPFAGLDCYVVKDGMVEDEEGNTVGILVEGDPKKLIGRAVDEDGDIIDKYGNVKGHAEPYEAPEEEPVDLSILAGKVVNKQGNVVDEHGTIFGRIAEGDPKALAGRKVDGEGNIWSDDGKVIGRAELIPGGEQAKPEGPFSGFDEKTVAKEGMVVDGTGEIIGRLLEESMPKAKELQGRSVDDDGDVLDKAGNVIGKAERWEPEQKERRINPMSGHKVNKDGEVRDENGELLGRVTEGDLPTLIGLEVDDNGYVVDNDGNRVGACTLIENIPEEEPEPEPEMTEEELEALRKKQQDAEIANKMNYILTQTLERIDPVLKQITERLDKADRTPKEELDEEELVKDVKPLLEEGGRILQECNGAIRGLDPDGSIAANAKARAASGEASPEEHRLAENLKELTTNVVKTIDNAKKRVADMPHAKKELSPLWALLTEPLFQIIAAVGLLLSGVLGLVGKLLNGLGLGGLVNGILGGLGIDKLLGGLGLGSISEALGFGGGKKKK